MSSSLGEHCIILVSISSLRCYNLRCEIHRTGKIEDFLYPWHIVLFWEILYEIFSFFIWTYHTQVTFSTRKCERMERVPTCSNRKSQNDLQSIYVILEAFFAFVTVCALLRPGSLGPLSFPSKRRVELCHFRLLFVIFYGLIFSLLFYLYFYFSFCVCVCACVVFVSGEKMFKCLFVWSCVSWIVLHCCCCVVSIKFINKMLRHITV